MAMKWSKLRAGMSPAAQARSAAHAEAMPVELKMAELRRAQDRTPVEVAQTMDEEQVVISVPTDHMALSTLQDDMQAPEGELRLIALSLNAEIQIRPEHESNG